MSRFVIWRLRKKVQLWFLLRNVGLVFMTWDSIEVHLRLMTKGRKSRESIFSIFPTFSLHFLFLSFQCFLSSCPSFIFPSLSPSFSCSLSVQWHFCIFFNVTAASGRICCVYVIGEFPFPIISPPLHMFHFRNQLALCVPLLPSFYSQKTWTIWIHILIFISILILCLVLSTHPNSFAGSRFPIHNSTYFLFSSTFNPFLLPRRPPFPSFHAIFIKLHASVPSVVFPTVFLVNCSPGFPNFRPFFPLLVSSCAATKSHHLCFSHVSENIFGLLHRYILFVNLSPDLSLCSNCFCNFHLIFIEKPIKRTKFFLENSDMFSGQ